MVERSSWTTAEIVAARNLTSDIREITFRLADGRVTVPPGAHVDFAVVAAGRPDIRSYSLIGTEAGDTLSVAVRRQPQGRGGSAAMWALRPGDGIRVTRPIDGFPLVAGRGETLLVAGGIGITPMIGMAETLARRGASFRLVYCGRSRSDLAYLDRLAALGPALDLRLDDEGGRIDLAAEIARLPADGQIYVCGPIGMLEDARRLWREAGRRPALFKTETFGSSGHAANMAFTVEIPDLGVSVAVPADMSMLEALEAAGVETMSECRRGECGLCAVNVVSVDGAVDHRDVYLSDEQKAHHEKICTCVSRVAGGSITVDTGWRRDELPAAAE